MWTTHNRLEIPVDGADPVAWQQLQQQIKQLRQTNPQMSINLPAGVSDYALYRPNGEIGAVVEVTVS